MQLATSTSTSGTDCHRPDKAIAINKLPVIRDEVEANVCLHMLELTHSKQDIGCQAPSLHCSLGAQVSTDACGALA